MEIEEMHQEFQNAPAGLLVFRHGIVIEISPDPCTILTKGLWLVVRLRKTFEPPPHLLGFLNKQESNNDHDNKIIKSKL